jgi:hypothetical protein
VDLCPDVNTTQWATVQATLQEKKEFNLSPSRLGKQGCKGKGNQYFYASATLSRSKLTPIAATIAMTFKTVLTAELPSTSSKPSASCLPPSALCPLPSLHKKHIAALKQLMKIYTRGVKARE